MAAHSRHAFGNGFKIWRDLTSTPAAAARPSLLTPSTKPRQNGGGLFSRWSKKLPDDLMQLILQRLIRSDYLNCRDVCRSWRAAMDSKRCLPANDPPNQLPWLLVDSCHSFYIKDDCFVSDRSIYESHKYRLRFSPGSCIGSVEGWLIMCSHKFQTRRMCFFFLNPVSGGRVMLPSYLAPKHYHYRLKAVASSLVPTKTRLQQQPQRCYVACLHIIQEEGRRLALSTPTDKSWTFIEAEGDRGTTLAFRDIEIVDGKLYAIGSLALEFLMVFNIQFDSNGSGLHTYTTEKLITLHPDFERGVVEDMTVFIRYCHLAKGSESKDLFMIIHKQSSSDQKTIEFQVLKLENNTSPQCCQWVEIFDLGNQVLFLGGSNNKFISSGSTSNDHILERNSIYLVFDWSRTTTVCESGVFCLTNRSIKPKDHPHEGLNEIIWFTPNSW